MELFHCTCEGEPILFFDNFECTNCARPVGYLHETQQVVPFTTSDNNTYTNDGKNYMACTNRTNYGVCNSMVTVGTDNHADALCFACSLNQMVPDLNVNPHMALWKNLESAKRRTLYTLQKLNLPIPSKAQDPHNGLVFNFMADRSAGDHFQTCLIDSNPVYTGHDSGEITINLAEADAVARNRTMVSLDEKYRTLLGHFRHEIGHFYWDHLVKNTNNRLIEFRTLFGDDQIDYDQAIKQHYDNGPPSNWQESYVSAYATMHPWEDWAETWAHYLHIVDTLDTAQAHGLLNANNIYQMQIETMLEQWMSFSIKLNAVNRSMGLPDAYPFVLSLPIRGKLVFVHKIVAGLN